MVKGGDPSHDSNVTAALADTTEENENTPKGNAHLSKLCVRTLLGSVRTVLVRGQWC